MGYMSSYTATVQRALRIPTEAEMERYGIWLTSSSAILSHSDSTSPLLRPCLSCLLKAACPGHSAPAGDWCRSGGNSL